jgi:dihydroorotate dehydrogenase (fumarate)
MKTLATKFVGLKLKNPLIASSSPLTGNFESAKALEKAGIAAIILPSLFEEEILDEEEEFYSYIMEQDSGSAEGDSFLPQSLQFENTSERYVSLIKRYKKELNIPIIASLNGCNAEVLTVHAKEIEEAGADALELNLYQVICQTKQSAKQVENDYIKLLGKMRESVSIPIIVKISSQFTSIPHFVKRVEKVGINGVSLFNRFYQPDIHLESNHIKHEMKLSTSYESLRRIRWTAILRDQVKLSLGVTGVMHESDQVIKATLAGADATYLCSVLLKQGVDAVGPILKDLETWLEEKECLSLEQIKGSVSYNNAIDSSSYERAAYVDLISKNNWKLV